MDKYELKRIFLPMLHDIQMKMINLSEQEFLITELEEWDDWIDFSIRQHYIGGKSISVKLSLYDFYDLGINMESYRRFKIELKQKIGIVL